jgi:ectoine hydroxylase-related dioxygenase (phytanoyl-CoA dioxygenase family)
MSISQAVISEEIVDIFDNAGYSVSENQLVASSDSVADFVQRWGKPDSTRDGVRAWWNVQTRKGCARGDLVVLETPAGTIAYFAGEA